MQLGVVSLGWPWPSQTPSLTSFSFYRFQISWLTLVNGKCWNVSPFIVLVIITQGMYKNFGISDKNTGIYLIFVRLTTTHQMNMGMHLVSISI